MPSENLNIAGVAAEELDELKAISIKTFKETFAEHNTLDDMQTYVSENLSLERLSKEWHRAGSRFYFLRCDDAIAGYMKLNTGAAQTVEGKESTLEIERIYVLKTFHGKQFGKLLLDHAITIAGEHHYSTIWLGVWERNTKAITFYERNGFVKTGSHDFVLGHDVQTDHVMELKLM